MSRTFVVLIFLGVCAVWLSWEACWGDSIVVEGTRYDGVYVRESDSLYYVQEPDSGKVRSFPKNQVEPSQVTLSADAAERSAILSKWEAARSARNPEYVVKKREPRLLKETDVATSVAKKVSAPAGTANRAATLGTGGGGRTGSANVTATGGGGFAGGGGAGGQAGFGGGGAAQAGGQAGGGGQGRGGAMTFSNISQLFSTIDDRLVGEPPAVIGITVIGGN